jgi:hypothetical protein
LSNVVSGYRIIGGTMAAGDLLLLLLLLLLCDHVGVTNMGEVSMGGYFPHINRLFVVFALVVRWNTTDSELHATDAIAPLARDFGSWTWRHWSL